MFIDAKVISLFSLFVWSEGDGWAAALSCLSPLLALRTHEVAGICCDLPPFPPGPLLLGTLEGQNAFFVSAA